MQRFGCTKLEDQKEDYCGWSRLARRNGVKGEAEEVGRVELS